jgi:DNA-binding CsgD family transcriptional regulator
MAETVSEGDVRKLVTLLEEGRRDNPALGLPPIVLDLVQELVPCDFLSFLELEPTNHRCHLGQDSSEVVADLDESDADPFWFHFWDCPPCSYSVVSGDDRTVTTISDFYSQRQWHHTGMYIDCLGEQGVEHEAMICISSPTGRARRLVLFRSGGPDFDQRDRLLLALLRPHLDELYQDLQHRRQPDLGLTGRQRELLRLVATGYSNTDIARSLVISAATVRTHLDKIFKVLDVTNRTAAVAKAFPSGPY